MRWGLSSYQGHKRFPDFPPMTMIGNHTELFTLAGFSTSLAETRH